MTQINMINTDNFKHTEITERAIKIKLLLNFGKKPECKRKVFSNNKNLIKS